MTTLLLGNSDPVGSRQRDGEEVTLVHFPDGAEQVEAGDLAATTTNDRNLNRVLKGGAPKAYALALCDLEAVWPLHGNGNPSWVSSDDADFARAVAAHFEGPGDQGPEVLNFDEAQQRREARA